MSCRRIISSVRRFLHASLAAVLLCVLAPSAPAQFGMGMGGMGSMAQQDTITRRGLDAYARLLGLDPDQKETALSLLEGNQSATRAAMKEYQAKMEALGEKARDSGDFSVYQKEMPTIAREMAEKFEGLEKGFFGDLKSILNEEQTARWPSVERYRLREQAMRFGFVSGSAVDLIAVVEKTKSAPAGNAEFTETLDQYELDVDRLLRNFEKAGKEAQKDALEGAQMFDMAKIEAMMKKLYDAAREVRDVNRAYARRLAPLMNDTERAAFEAEVQRRSFPRVYKPSHAAKSIDAALGFKDLSADQKESLQALRESYTRDLAAVNERWAKATEEKEEKAGGAVMVMMQGFMGGGSPDDPVKQAKDARKELDEKTQDRLEAVLSPDQKARLPEKKIEPSNPMADFMPELEDQEQESK
jgi:hypothetical protein